jgi:WD40 repeat protein
VQSVLLRQDCEVIGAVTETGSILYDAATGDVLAQDAIERGDARQLYSSESGIGVASADRDDFVRLWAFARRGDSEPLWRGGYQAGPAVSPDGRWVATVTNEGLRLTDLETRESTPIVLRSDGEQGPDYGMIEDLLLGPGGKLLLWQDFEGNTHLAVRSNDEANKVEMPRFDEQSLSLRNLGLTEEHLVALGPDGIFRFWETADPSDLGLSLPMTLTAPSEVQAFALSLDGQRLATASGAGKGVQIWDLSKDKPSATLVGEGVPALGAIRALALNRDGTQLAVMHDSPKDPAMATPVTVWDTNTGRQVAEISVVEALPELAFGPLETDDGQPRHLITAQGANGITTIYRQFLTVEELADRAAEVANCSLETDCLYQLFRRLRERAQAEAK